MKSLFFPLPKNAPTRLKYLVGSARLAALKLLALDQFGSIKMMTDVENPKVDCLRSLFLRICRRSLNEEMPHGMSSCMDISSFVDELCLKSSSVCLV
jgi:hypothetical protein